MPGRYLSLGHWRGAAALWVMFYHGFNIWLRDDPARLSGWPRAVLSAGWQGVSVFFVISGYCIAARLEADRAIGRGPGRFLGDRALRIFPAFWGALACWLALELAALPFNHGNLGRSFGRTGILPNSFLEGLANVFLVETWFAPRSWLLVSWSLDFEIGFYLVAALALALMQWRRAAWPGVVLAGAAAVTGLLAPRLPVLSLFPHFALGGLAWLLLSRWPGSALGRRLAAFGPLRWLGWTGTISYSLYLVHAPIVSKARNLGFALYPATAAGAVWLPLVACGIALAAAAVFYHLVEAPFERLRRRLLSRPSPA